MSKKICLVIETHSDDSCISAFGFLNKYKDEFDYKFHLVTCSSVSLTHAGQVDRNIRFEEYKNYVNFLGGEIINNPLDQDTKLREFPYAQLVGEISKSINTIKPDLLLFTGRSIHQDHTRTHEAVITALRPCGGFYPNSIWIMENPTNVHRSPEYNPIIPSIFCELTEEEVDFKLKMFSELFPSQIRPNNTYLSDAGIKDWARYRGIEGRCTYAEAFYNFSHKV